MLNGAIGLTYVTSE